MTLGKSVFIVAFFTLLYTGPVSSHNVEQVNNWLEYCPNSQLCFKHPSTLIPADLPVIDSIAGQLSNDSMTLFYDLGRYTSTFSELADATSEVIKVDGHQGKILIQQKKMALTIPTIFGELGFSMLIEFKNSLDIEQGKKIFKSVKFNLRN